MTEKDASEIQHAGIVFTYSQLVGETVALDRFLRELGSLRRSDVAEWTSTILQASSEMYGQSRDVQLALIDLCLEGPLKDAAIKAISQPGRNVVFFRRQLWLLFQFASLVCSDDGIPLGTDPRALGKLALIASDLLHEIQLVQVSNDIADKETMEWKVAMMISAAEGMPDIHSIARAHNYWIASAKDATLVKKLEKSRITESLESAFQRQTGMALFDCFFALFTLHMYLSKRVNEQPPSPIVLTDTDSWWGSVPAEHRTKVLRQLAIPTSRFPVHLFGESRQSWATDLACLMAHPLVEISAGKFLCPEIRHLREFFIEGIFWILAKAYPEADWKKAFGDIYEWYISRIFLAAMPDDPDTERKYFERVKFQGTNHEVCDGLILSDTHAFLCEFKGKRLTNRQKSGVSVNDTIAGVKTCIASDDVGIGQLAKNIKRILRGDVAVSGNRTVDIASKQVLVPVIVWHEEAGCNIVTRAYLDNLLAEMLGKENVDLTRVSQTLLLSTHDVEMFERCCTYDKPDVILKQFADAVEDDPADAKADFKRFAIHRFNGRPLPKGHVGTYYDQLIADMKDHHARLKSSEATE